MRSANIAVAPSGIRDWLADAVRDGGGTPAAIAESEALVWTAPAAAAELAATLDTHPAIRWVALPFAGIEPLVEVVRSRPDLVWTAAKGVYAEPVAEMALALLLAGLRNLGPYAAADEWTAPAGKNLAGARLTILGAGGITASLVRMVTPFAPELTVVRRRPEPFPGVDRVLGFGDLDAALAGADAVVLALALTPDTVGVLDARRFALLAPGATVVNVARGAHIVTDDLVRALESGHLGSAGLDVTDPEPLPTGHPLWGMPNVIITPHVGNTPEMAVPLLAARISENVRRWVGGEALVGLVDPSAGY